MLRWIKAITLGFIGLVALIFLVFWIIAPVGMNPDQFSKVSNQYNVEIIRDNYGVPHIYGQRDIDVAFGLAYAHAEDDFDTIEDVILATRGLMASHIGMPGAVSDYLIGFMGVKEAIDARYEKDVTPEARALAEAYADGLNAYIADKKPETSPYMLPVTGKDVVAGFTFKTPLFYGFDKSLLAAFDGVYGDRLNLEDKAFQAEVGAGPDLGSQGISVAPSRSGGETMLLVNSHQPLTGPVAWYEVRVKSEEGWDMVGGTFPGSPLVLHGAGPKLGWASTVNKPDLVDVYQLTINPENNNQYLLDGTWIDFEQKTISIEVKLAGPIRWTFERELRLSAFGPVVDGPQGALAFNWAGRGEVRMLNAYLAMNKATDQASFEAALAQGVLPSINYVMADSQGGIGHYYNAMFPKRPSADVDWAGLIRGNTADVMWSDYRPFTDMPKTVNPPSGVVYNANNTPYEATDGVGAPLAGEIPLDMGVQTNMTNRAHRLKRLVADSETLDFGALRAIKYDASYDENSVVIQRLKAFLKGGLSPEDRANTIYKDAFEQLKKWDLNTDLENPNAALGVLTIFPTIGAQLADTPLPPVKEGFKAAVDHLISHFGRLDVKWREVNKIKRGDSELPIAGGPDILRAVYGWPPQKNGALSDTAGDSYILFARWLPDGRFIATSVHSFGSATLDEQSSHYADQLPLFVEEREKPVPMDRATLDIVAKARKSFGGYTFKGVVD